MIGTTLGHYKVIGLLGKGGMGEVFRARDTRLDRFVAIKQLPEHLASDPDRLRRFRTEARLLAQLNHPNVAGIHGVEEQDDASYLVLEYVEGETLASRIARRPLSTEDAVAIGRRIAAGVEAAHEAGILHRDLKPGNIHLTPRGDVKILDFGLAKSADPAQSGTPTRFELADSPTVAASATGTGLILGTAAYMSPEQAKGLPVDRRTDVWSFGVTLLECLTGSNPFAAPSAAESIARILRADVDLTPVPPALRRVLRRCLERDVTARYRDLGDVSLDLAESLESGPDAPSEPARSTVRRALGFGLPLAITAAVLGWMLKPTPPSTSPPRLDAEIALPEGQRFAHTYQRNLAISPDGQTIAFFTGDVPDPDLRRRWIRPKRLLTRNLSQPEAVAVAGTEVFGSEPTFSPDGKWIAYWTDSGICKIPVAGGQATRLSGSIRTCCLSWGSDDRIVIGGYHAGLSRIPAAGGELEQLTTLNEVRKEYRHSQPQVLPGAKAVLFTVQRFGYQTRAPSAYSIWVLDLRTRERHLLMEHASQPGYYDGHLLFVREAVLYAAPFDIDKLAITGVARVAVEGIHHSVYENRVSGETGAAQYAIATNGTLVYASGGVAPAIPRQVLRVDRRGNTTPIAVPPRPYHTVRSTEDGSRLLLSVHYPPETGVWMFDAIRGVTSLQRTGDQGHFAYFGPGPYRITYDETDTEGTRRNFSKPIDTAEGVGETPVPDPPLESIWGLEWSRDGNVLFGWDLENDDMWSYSEADGWYMIPRQHPNGGWWPTLSPDGRWLAYATFIEGRFEVMVQPFGHEGSFQQITSGGGASPIWSHDGHTLYYRVYYRPVSSSMWGSKAVVAVAVTDAGDHLEFGTPNKLFDDHHRMGGPARSWDLLGDDAFVFISEAASQEYQAMLLRRHPDRLHVVQAFGVDLD